MSSYEIMEIDDQALGAISYFGDWALVSSVDAYGDTLHEATSSSATADVTFTGTDVTVYGTITPTDTAVVSTYTIDKSKNVTTYSSPITSSVLNNVTFFSTEGLTYTSHTLTISYVRNNSTATNGTSSYYLVYVVYAAPKTLATLPTVSSALTSPTAISLVSRSAAHSGPPIGPIVGGTVGGVAFILACIFGLLYLRRRRRKLDSRNAGTVTPFVDPLATGYAYPYPGASVTAAAAAASRSQHTLHSQHSHPHLAGATHMARLQPVRASDNVASSGPTYSNSAVGTFPRGTNTMQQMHDLLAASTSTQVSQGGPSTQAGTQSSASQAAMIPGTNRLAFSRQPRRAGHHHRTHRKKKDGQHKEDVAASSRKPREHRFMRSLSAAMNQKSTAAPPSYTSSPASPP